MFKFLFHLGTFDSSESSSIKLRAIVIIPKTNTNKYLMNDLLSSFRIEPLLIYKNTYNHPTSYLLLTIKQHGRRLLHKQRGEGQGEQADTNASGMM